ncbi:MAG: hypothetical protein KatS3mg125_0925 [Lysobacterales bacterium]|jgi:hypothetical protein|nr:MAG: hypothetical protein KatS3mg125_0925 [Xanthomonadales bacterium]
MARILFAAVAALLVAPSLASAKGFDLEYEVRFLPPEGIAQVVMRIAPDAGVRVSRLDLAMPSKRYQVLAADGALRRQGPRLLWEPPAAGGALHYAYRIERRRGSARDALINERFALLRGDHLFPAARLLATRDARSRTSLRFRLPEGWSVETPYPRRDGEVFHVDWPGRRLSRPVGWLIAGDLGVRREVIGGTQWVVAAPRGERMRRQDLLALLRILHPELEALFGELPDKFLIVGAGKGFWRGGLSGPRSLYLHVDRPLIQEDGTSPLVHELVHSLSRIRGIQGERWIAEAFAEYYAVELIHRAGLIGDARRQRIWRGLERRAAHVSSLSGGRCSGSCVAAAALELRTLDRRIRRLAPSSGGVDELTRRLARRHGTRIAPDELLAEAEAIAGAPLGPWPRRAIASRSDPEPAPRYESASQVPMTGRPSASWSMK